MRRTRYNDSIPSSIVTRAAPGSSITDGACCWSIRIARELDMVQKDGDCVRGRWARGLLLPPHVSGSPGARSPFSHADASSSRPHYSYPSSLLYRMICPARADHDLLLVRILVNPVRPATRLLILVASNRMQRSADVSWLLKRAFLWLPMRRYPKDTL
jgi:hypothetical protein